MVLKKIFLVLLLHNVAFNKEYKIELKNRILNFFNFKIEEKRNSLTWQELKIFLNENIVFKKDIINSLYLSKIEEEIVIKEELSEYIISSGLLYINKIEFNIGVNYILDFENKEVIFENTEIKVINYLKMYLVR